jgi:hypothetical protein
MRQIRFERSGGLLGRPAALTLDLESLPAKQARKLARLLDESDFFSLPPKTPGRPSPDEYHYKISVEIEERSHSVEISDTTAPERLRPLLEELAMLVRSKRA